MLKDYRVSISELTKDERDLVILSQISAHRTRTDIVPVNRCTNHYYFAHIPICQETFRFLHSVGQKQLESLIKHLDSCGLTPRTHDNRGKVPHNALQFEDRVHVKTFIENTAVARGIPLPGRLPNAKDLTVTLLPTDTTKASLHREYVAACQKDNNRRPYGLNAFKVLWLTLCPQVRISEVTVSSSSGFRTVCALHSGRGQRSSRITKSRQHTEVGSP